MSKKNYLSDAEILESSRVRLENAEKQPIIAEKLKEYGYNTEKIALGIILRTKAEEAYSFKKLEDNESSEIYNKFSKLKELLSENYMKDRKVAKIVFAKSPETLNSLGINGSVSDNYVKWHETVKTFYTSSQASAEIQRPLATLKISVEHINKMSTSITEMEHLRADYLREKGESQNATNLKDDAFAALDDWMREFKSVAKIALEENSQLLEALRI